MKTRLKTIVSAFVATSLVLAAAASEPVEWTAKPGDGPKSFVRHHGSTLEFRCAFAGFGGAFAESAGVRLWYQTNGMGRAWWSVPAARSNDVLSASWPPSADPGADRVSFFFGAPSNAYASAVVRLQHSPGFAPNVLAPPVATLDFGAIEVQNPPFWTRDESDARYGGVPVTESVVAGWGFTKTVLPSSWPWTSVSGRPDMTQYLTAADASTTYATQTSLATSLAEKLDADGGTATDLTVGGEFRLTDVNGYFGTIQYAGNDQDNSSDWYVGVPGYWLGQYRLRHPGPLDVATVAFTSDLAPYAAASSVASNALPRAEAARTYATQTALASGLSSRMSLTGSNGVDETWALAHAGAGPIIEIVDYTWWFRGVAESSSYADETSIIQAGGGYDGAAVSDELDGRLRMRFFRSDDGQGQDVEGWSATIADIDAIPTTYASTNAIVSVNCSVQTLVNPVSVGQFLVPAAVAGGVRDWIVHVVNTGSADISLAANPFPAQCDGKAALFYSPMSSDDIRKACKASRITTFCFSEIGHDATSVFFLVMRAENDRVSPPAN